ncbi:MAG: glycerophosphodiester phosphodiesterase family protein, partial [Isosphaeraceae bacterium]
MFSHMVFKAWVPRATRFVVLLPLCAPLMTWIAARASSQARPESRTHQGPAFFPFHQPVQPPRPVQVMAHRGLAAATPENSSAAITSCIDEFLEWAEIDLRLSRDGVHIVAHDERLERTSNGRGAVGELTAEQLLSLDAGSWFAPRHAGTRLLTLAQALEIARGR